MAKIFVNAFMDSIAPALNSPGIRASALQRAKEIFEERQDNLLGEFENHPVTQDLEDGPHGESNRSGAISGPGNLYSFIGFQAGYDPTGVLRNILEKDIKLLPGGAYNRTLRGFIFQVSIPTMDEIYKQTPFQGWDGGISWVRGIESYISGLNYYLSAFNPRIPSRVRGIIAEKSRSGTAIQSEKLSKQFNKKFIQFKRREYLSKMMQKFRAQFKGPGGRFF